MSLYGLPNPDITVNILLKMYKEMDPTEYQKTVKDILTRGTRFIAMDDSTFSSSLDEEDADLYMSACKSFVSAFKELEKNKSIRNPVYLAKATAWWQCVSAIRTLHGKPLLLVVS